MPMCREVPLISLMPDLMILGNEQTPLFENIEMETSESDVMPFTAREALQNVGGATVVVEKMQPLSWSSG